MVVKRIDDDDEPLYVTPQQPLETSLNLSSQNYVANNHDIKTIIDHKRSSSSVHFKTNLNKFISNSDILIKINRNNHNHNNKSDLPQRIYYENILSDLKTNQKSKLIQANSASTTSLNEQFILNFSNQKNNSIHTLNQHISNNNNNDNNHSSINLFQHEEGLDEFIDEYNRNEDANLNLDAEEDVDFGSSLSTTSSSSQSADSKQLNNQVYATSKSSDSNSLSISDLSGSPLSLNQNSSSSSSSCSNNLPNISVTIDTNDIIDCNGDSCQLTPTQFTSFRRHDHDINNEEEDDTDSESRRDTVTYSKINNNQNESSLHEFQLKNNILTSNSTDVSSLTQIEQDQNNILLLKAELSTSLAHHDSNKSKSNNSKLSSGKSTISSVNSLYLACEVASLSSLTSDYSQFDFLSNNNNNNTNKVTLNQNTQELNSKSNISSNVNNTTNKSNGGLTSFFFSNSLFGNKKSKDISSSTSVHNTIEKSSNSPINNINSSQIHSHLSANTPTTSNKTLDLIASKFFNIKTNSVKTVAKHEQHHAEIASSASSASLTNFNSTENGENVTDNTSLKTNHSSNNIAGISSIQVPSSVLIFENRPSNLPAKSHHEAIKHKQEYEKMVEIAKKKEQKENQTKLKKYEQQMKKEDFMANSLKIWNSEILPNWSELKGAKRTNQLWWHGLPPSIRGKVWKLAIGNELNLNKESYIFYEKKAKQKLELLSKNEELIDQNTNQSSSVELIKLDVSRTFPQLCFFQRDGPYHEALHSVLGAYACFNPKMGYVQGMSFLTAIFLLNMEAPDAFICLSNLLNTKYLLACFCMDQAKMNRYFRVHQILLEHNLPKLYKHFESQKVKPDLYLIEWIFTLFSKSLPLDVMSRVWDVFFRDKEEFLFRTALGILNMYKDTLLQMDFIHIVQFLTKLPDNINSTVLFKSIEQIETNIDEFYFTFEHLIADTPTTPSSFHSKNSNKGTSTSSVNIPSSSS